MAWKAYNTVNGMILGESDSERATDYQTDALGSVVGTFHSNGALENTYRYAGYGQQVSKTGTGADPKVLWVGGYGGRMSVEFVYFVRRHYNLRRSVWTTIDPLWPEEAAYLYALANPAENVDPMGMGPNQHYPEPEDNLPKDCIPTTGARCDFNQEDACRLTCDTNYRTSSFRCYTRQVTTQLRVCCCRCNPCEDVPWSSTNKEDALKACTRAGETAKLVKQDWATQCWGRHFNYRMLKGQGSSRFVSVLCCYCSDPNTGVVKIRCKCK